MKEILKLGLSENTINSMIELNVQLKNITNEEVIEKINLLRKINCSENQILNIISSNSLYFNKSREGILKLFNYLSDLGFELLNILLDSNPYILNLEIFEIDRYIMEREKKGENKEDIIDNLFSNPYLFNEM